ncbi:MAG: aspartate kinase [Spirochaetales bacterium]|jgi:aspartokinase/homoserine dehydrogenase 1|nr:aspartate kinase [Spirochaetales bacterium]
MKTLKFGGSSVEDAGKIRHVISIIKNEAGNGSLCVVCSAMKGVTDELIRAARLAEEGRPGYRALLERLEERLIRACEGLFPQGEREASFSPLFESCGELLDILHGVELVRECTPRSLDLIMSFGERLNCALIAGAMRSMGINARYVDARELIVTDERYGSARVDFTASCRNIRRRLGGALSGRAGAGGVIFIVTGFIAATSSGVTTTLGRNGSDYTAALCAAALDSQALEVWKDVDGVLSADPNIVRGAFVIDEVSYEEAMEMSFFGAEIIHPYTMGPVLEKNIPLRVKNTLNPSVPGTLIARDIGRHEWPITSIASIGNAALINVEGSGMQGTPGIASRVFAALAKADVNVIMISQASSEHSICIVIRAGEAKKALSALKAELAAETQARLIGNFAVMKDLEIVAIIGENMRGRPGISGELFSALGRAGVNVLAIAQGSSERNISFVVDGRDKVQAINTVHRAFFGAAGKRKSEAKLRTAGPKIAAPKKAARPKKAERGGVQ